jgi:anti-sigma B factor antagonist
MTSTTRQHQTPAHTASHSEQAWYRIDQAQGCVVVTAGGEIDLHTAPGFDDAGQVAAQFSPRVVIDLSDVTFLDSCGLQVLLRMLTRASTKGAQVALVGAPGIVYSVLAVTQIDGAIAMHDDLDEAIAELQHA